MKSLRSYFINLDGRKLYLRVRINNIRSISWHSALPHDVRYRALFDKCEMDALFHSKELYPTCDFVEEVRA